MNRSEILDTAKEYITKDRATTHGDAEANFGLIAAYWSAHLGRNIKPHDVAVMMTLLKLARAKSNPAHADNWVDGCGYLACGGEIVTARQTEGEPMQREYGVWKPIETAPKDRELLFAIWDETGPYFVTAAGGWDHDDDIGFWNTFLTGTAVPEPGMDYFKVMYWAEIPDLSNLAEGKSRCHTSSE